MTRTREAHWAGPVTPTSDTADGANVGRVGEQHITNGANFQCSGIPPQAADDMEGEAYARAWLDRLRAGVAQPGELAVILSFITGEMLHGACRLIERAVGVRHA